MLQNFCYIFDDILTRLVADRINAQIISCEMAISPWNRNRLSTHTKFHESSKRHHFVYDIESANWTFYF